MFITCDRFHQLIHLGLLVITDHGVHTLQYRSPDISTRRFETSSLHLACTYVVVTVVKEHFHHFNISKREKKLSAHV